MPTITQTVAGAAQFDGLTAATGLFSFAEFNLNPFTTRVVINRISYHSDIPGMGGSGGTQVDFRFVDPDGVLTAVILIGRGLDPAITGPDGSADFGVCGGVVPRRPGRPSPSTSDGDHWNLVVTSAGKTVTATVAVDYSVIPVPSTSPGDPLL